MLKPTQSELENLIKIFQKARDQLLETIIKSNGVGTKVYANTVLKQLEKQLKTLEKHSAFYVRSVIPKEYQKALDELYGYFTKNNLLMKPPQSFAALHNDAIYEIAREMQYQIGQGLEQAGRQIIRYVNDARDNTLRLAGLEATGQKLASGATVQQMRNNLIERLQNEGFFTVQYGEGKNARQVGVDTYASMVARSTTREAGNLARENQLSANGYDLVEMTEHYPTCGICAQFQGRIYSISGNDKRFPPLSKAFKSGYHNVHPNCRHSVAPWVESMHTTDEIAKAIKKSNRPFEDNRPEEEKALYTEQQAENRKIRQDRYQYERYKERLGEDAPKSFHAFRIIKKAGGEKWEDLKYIYSHTLTNANGNRIIKVKQEDVKIQSVPNSITQTESKKGGINRNYYGEKGFQIKQISNNHHGHKSVMQFGKKGEHAHDYIYDGNNNLIERPYRELTEQERKENADIL